LEGLSREELIAVVLAQAGVIEELRVEVARLAARVATLEAEAKKNSGNSSLPPSRDPVAERRRQAEARQEAQAARGGGKRRRPGKQRGAPGSTLALSDTPDVVLDHAPVTCGGCGAGLGDAEVTSVSRRQVIDLPEVHPVVTEHRAQTRLCSCGQATTAPFPQGVRAPVSYGPRVRAVVCYLLARQHIPVERCAEAMADLFGIKISTGTIDAVYTDAARRLRGFITALVAVLRSLPVLHADETTDRVGTTTCWMHVVSTRLYTLIHASTTRGHDAVVDAGVLIGYRGVIIHDRLALYWKLKRAKHGLCGAHLLRDLASVAEVATQTAWATGLASLLVEINRACDTARAAGHRRLAPGLQHQFRNRYDTLVTAGQAANPEPLPGRKRDTLQRASHNLVTAFATHRTSILRSMYDLNVSFSNNQAERDLRPVKLHRKISSCFRSQTGAERFAHVRSYLSTTRKHDIPAIDALTRLFKNDPWMPSPSPTT
jgi:transposase